MTPATDEVQETVPEETPAQETASTKEERARSTWSIDPEGDPRFASSPALRQALNLETHADATIEDPSNPRGAFQTAVRDILASRFGAGVAEQDLTKHVAQFMQGTKEGRFLDRYGKPSVSGYIVAVLAGKASRQMPDGKGVWAVGETSPSLEKYRVERLRMKGQPRTVKSVATTKEAENAPSRLAVTGIAVPEIAPIINEAIGAETKTPIDIYEDQLEHALDTFPQTTMRGIDDVLKARIRQKLLNGTGGLSGTGRAPAHALGLTEDDFTEIARTTNRPLKIVKSRADAIYQHIRAVRKTDNPE